MKIHFILFLILTSLYHCEDQNPDCDETCEKMIKQRNENNQKFNETLKQALKEMNLENEKTITIEQFKVVFMKLFKLGKSETNYKEEDDEEYRNKIFNNLAPKNSTGIEVDNIFKLFDPMKILNSLKNIETSLGKYNKIEFLSENLRSALKDIEEEEKRNSEKNTDL